MLLDPIMPHQTTLNALQKLMCQMLDLRYATVVNRYRKSCYRVNMPLCQHYGIVNYSSPLQAMLEAVNLQSIQIELVQH